eukprot:TRINITY_DN3444_c0_g2_i1.p1 TRINITY_DN3444_c0_g2~~TRINITY_DN3444_c0_g2_i1.p1  ORF type:complete len:665 (+),score=177.51 TRINITY_DN3444_c0_g2_i1:81-2075(+)
MLTRLSLSQHSVMTSSQRLSAGYQYKRQISTMYRRRTNALYRDVSRDTVSSKHFNSIMTPATTVRHFSRSMIPLDKEDHTEKKKEKKSIDVQAWVTYLRELKWADVKKDIIDGAKHLGNSSKLLWVNIKLSSRLLWKSRTTKLSRREKKLLVTTFTDVLRLVPFSVFLVVPFMEFALPIALKIFPRMLPSTFETKDQKDQLVSKQVKLRLETAKLIQASLEELNLQQDMKEDFSDLLNKIKDRKISVEELSKYSEIFKDEVTIDTLPRQQLIRMCRLLGLNTYGPDGLLQWELKKKMNDIKEDDRLILEEGLETMTLEELANACIDRGIPVKGQSRILLKRILDEWVYLSSKNVPISLLILSQTIKTTSRAKKGSRENLLLESINSLPQEWVQELELSISKKLGVSNPELALEVLEYKLSLIQNEGTDEEQMPAWKKITEDRLMDIANILTQGSDVIDHDKLKNLQDEVTKYKAGGQLEKLVTQAIDKLNEEIAQKEEELGKSPEPSEELLLEYEEIQNQLAQKKNTLKELQRQKTLCNRLESRLDSLLDNLNKEIQEDIDSGAPQGFVTQEELTAVLKQNENFQDLDEKDFEFIFRRFDANQDGFIDLQELDSIRSQLGQKISEIERNRVREEMDRKELEEKLSKPDTEEAEDQNQKENTTSG